MKTINFTIEEVVKLFMTGEIETKGIKFKMIDNCKVENIDINLLKYYTLTLLKPSTQIVNIA
jgi:hypothetical protein